MSYNTGYEYVITGTNIEHDGATISAPSTTGNSNTLNGVTSTWTNLDLSNKPNFTMTTPGADFQFVESYSGPGLSNHTIIQRNNNYKQRHKHNKHLLKLISICLLGTASPTFASDIGGVSATANPVANSSGSVTNQADSSFTRPIHYKHLRQRDIMSRPYHERYSIFHRKYRHKAAV